MNWEYALLLVAVVSVPLVRSGDRNIRLYDRRGLIARTLLCVCIPYWVWDGVAAARGHWSFNPEFVLGVTMFGLPLEEWMFFPVVAFVSLFMWESTLYLLRKR
jgi:lycopene cyclase domain-containing protein